MNQFMGVDTIFWTGVVEDRADPLKLGRVRVRLAGMHSSELVENDSTGEGIPVKSLPWAYPGLPITSAGMNGIGDSPTGPVEGTWLAGISRDGRPCQNLVYLFVLPGIPQKEAINTGFNDTQETIKTTKRPSPLGKTAELFPRKEFIKEPDTNRLARNEKINQTIVQSKRNTEDKGVPKANGGTWDEKTTPYNASYPFNHVHETESGHILERDDTPGAERTHDYHRSGTFREVHQDGTTVEKIKKDKYDIVLGNNFVHIIGECNITVNGNANIKAANVNIEASNTKVKSSNITLEAGTTNVIGFLTVGGVQVVLKTGQTTDSAGIASTGQ